MRELAALGVTIALFIVTVYVLTVCIVWAKKVGGGAANFAKEILKIWRKK